MKILYGNICLEGRSGTEVVTLETAIGLQSLGHEVAVVVSRAGAAADGLRERGIPVLTYTDPMPWRPEIVHANHLHQALYAARRFPEAPQIFVGHDATSWHSVPPRLNCVRRYCAVDQICAERMSAASGVSPDKIQRLPNAVDLTRFAPRGALPPVPRRALLVTKDAAHLPATQAACEDHGITLDRLGAAFGREVDDFAERLPRYDLVFAAARTALEALAAGCAVVVVDGRGLAGMATSQNIEAWRRHNLGQRLLTREPTRAALFAEVALYDPNDARRVTEHVRCEAGLKVYLQQLLGVYQSVLQEAELRPLDRGAARAAFPDAFYAALPNLLAGVRAGLAAEEVAALADGLPPEFSDLWLRLSKRRQEFIAAQSTTAVLREEYRQSAERIVALQAALEDTNRRAAAAERDLGSRSALLRRLWKRIFRGKSGGENQRAA